MFTKLKAEKLVKEFTYLKTKSYFPFGLKGREFKIADLEYKLPELNLNPNTVHINKRDNPNYVEEREEKHQNGENWKVIVTIKNATDKFEVEILEVLKVLKIRHDIEKIFNE